MKLLADPLAAPRSVRAFAEYSAPARLDRRTKDLVRRLDAGDIAIVDHADLDRVSAEELIEAGVRVVVNVAESQTGRFPNPGPLTLVQGGVRLIDAPGADLFERVTDGEVLTVRGGGVYRNGTRLVSGRVLEPAELAAALAEQRTRVTGRSRRSPRTRCATCATRGRLLAEGIAVPAPSRPASAIATRSSSRAARDTSATCGSCVPTSATFGPCSSVSTAALTLCSRPGYRPDVIVGDMDSVTDRALRCWRRADGARIRGRDGARRRPRATSSA